MRVILLLCMFVQLQYAFASADTENIMERVRYWSIVPNDSLVNEESGLMSENGSFPDINYAQTDRTGWTPQLHYHRLLDMVYGYVSSSSQYYKDDNLYEKIIKGMEYWIEASPKAENWYHTQIDEPLNFGLILISMRIGDKRIPQDLEEKVIDRWRNNGADPSKRGGSNRSEIALHWMYFACLTEDEELLGTALDYIFEPIEYTDYQGFQVDHSYFQHGHQLYIGGYGEVQLESVLQTACCVKDTKFNIPEPKLGLLRQYVLYSWANVIRGEVINWNSQGRQLSRKDYLKDPVRRVAIIDKMIEIDPQYKEDYQAIRSRLLGLSQPGDGVPYYHAHFYRGDYTIHTRPEYTFSTRMVSTRTCRQEKGNGENLLGYYLSDGSTDIAVSGNEYTDIMPLWDWNRIPGVTAPLLDTIPKTPELWAVYGTSDFAGGVSDSIYGCSAYRYYDEYSGVNTGACKGWFFFDDEVVCLGAGITSVHHAVTTVNQCWGSQEFNYSITNGPTETFDGETAEMQKNGVSWVLHNKVGYFFPDHQSVIVSNQETIGNWRWVSTVQEDKDISGKVFTLCVDHGATATNATYSYIVRPNSSVALMSDYTKSCPIEILANTDSVQIVRHTKLNLTEGIFYRGCKYSGKDLAIQATNPCALILKERDSDFLVHIADLTQSRQSIRVGIDISGFGDMVIRDCDFTDLDEQHAGMTKVFSVNLQSTGIREYESEKVEYTILRYPYRLCFNKVYRGKYRLLSVDGRELNRGNIDGGQINLDIRQKGIYLIDMNIDNHPHTTVKLIAD